LQKTPINNRWPVAQEGFPFLVVCGTLALVSAYLGALIPSILAGIACLFIVFFFRDPTRQNAAPLKALVVPADGKIMEVRKLEDADNPSGRPGLKISIFMSILDVHVNRIPIAGTIKKIIYNPGKFFSANLDKASQQNENNRIVLETPDARTIVFVQIAGLIARRIVCWVKENDRVEVGQRFGLIRFGSRVDVYLPYDSEIVVKPGERVKAGITILGYLP
jgi:phosphatidylserine decarboxylase